MVRSLRARRRLLVILLLLTSGITVFAQEKRVTLTGNNIPVEQVLTRIEQQTGHTFAYNKSRFDASRRVSLSLTQASLAEALQVVLEGSGYSYLINGHHIILLPLREAGTPAAVQPPAQQHESAPAQQSAPGPELPSPVQHQPVLTLDDIHLEAAGNSLYVVLPSLPRIEIPDRQILHSTTPYASRREPVHPLDRRLPVLALKTNLLYDATSTLNLGLEFRLSRRLSLDVSANYNPWKYNNNSKLRHIAVQPELRYWISEPLRGHFLGVHAQWAHYNAGGIGLLGSTFKNNRYKGDLYGAGIGYGYQLYLGPRWSMEFTAGLGYNRLQYERYECRNCGRFVEKANKNQIGPTKIGWSLTYILK